MYSVQVIANEVLKIAKRKGLSLTPMQLMKLVYIAHGWSLAVMKRDIFSDRIEAWKYGPVIPSLYQSTKHFGRDPIPHNLISDQELSEVDSQLEEFLNDVVSKYGHLSGIQLSNLTHMQGTPWYKVYRPNVMHLEITDDLIREHYAEKLNEYRQSSTTTTQ